MGEIVTQQDRKREDMNEELFNFGRFSIHWWGRINMVSFFGCSELRSPDFPKVFLSAFQALSSQSQLSPPNLNHTTCQFNLSFSD